MTTPMDISDASGTDIIARIGQLTRMLRTSLRELGLEQAIAQAAEAIPDARDRLDYVVQMTAQAAERALNCVEAAQPRQTALEQGARTLTSRWDAWFAEPMPLEQARELVDETRQYLADVPEQTAFTHAQLLEIMMALLENMPEKPAQPRGSERLLNGPQLDHTAAGVVANQDQVDDLLDSLGF